MQNTAQPPSPAAHSEQTFQMQSPSGEKPRRSALHMSIDGSEQIADDPTNAALVKHYEDQLDGLVQELKLMYETEAAKFKSEATESLKHTMSQLPPEVLGMKVSDFTSSCQDPVFKARYNKVVEVKDPQNLIGLAESESSDAGNHASEVASRDLQDAEVNEIVGDQEMQEEEGHVAADRQAVQVAAPIPPQLVDVSI